MKPTKGKLFVLVALVAAVGIVTATGAFGSVTASRTATVSVTGDDAALLALEANSGPGGSYVQGTDEIAIDVTSVNTNATLGITNVFTITNSGNEEVPVRMLEPSCSACKPPKSTGIPALI